MRVETDTSAFTIGGILTQQFEINGHLHWLPVAYYSKKLLDTETRYGTGARHPIVVLTDHANLVWFMTSPNLTSRQLKWAEKLAEYDFNVTYREGKKNPANSLSRRPDYELPKASTTSTAAETVQQSFRLGSNDYKPVQEKLYTLAVMTLRPRRPVRQVRQEDVVPNINMDGGTTGTPAVRNLSAREASRNGDAVVRRDNVVPDINMDGGTTGTPAVRNLSAREASRNGDAVHRSIEDSTADADAMDIDDTVDNDPIGLQIEAGASDKTVEALRLVATRTPIGDEATAYTKMSIKELERAICAKQYHNSLVRRVRQGLATPIEDRPNLAGPKMANAVPGTANMATNMAATMASIWSQWQEIDNVVYYDADITMISLPVTSASRELPN
ncbi:gag polymerase env [Lasallia pustulata]|uniref:Gag polymerase env n=1 Tax=Lasallia pustulata TaxID=136370 RepID=A0A1W5CUF0_9LECA|nr:gag polymerase env [Lasallia pustulata]